MVHILYGILFTNEENEIINFSGKSKKLENILLNKAIQAWKYKFHNPLIICIF